MLLLSIITTVTLLSAVNSQQQDFISPCPDIFTYNLERSSPGMWYGTVVMSHETELNGVWLRLRFDRPPLQIGNWFGQIISREENLEFTLKDRTFRLEPNEPKAVLFFVRYDSAIAPRLIRITLNGRQICPKDDKITTTPSIANEPITSRPLTADVGTDTQQNNERSTTRRPNRRTTTESSNEDDDFYPGDLSPSNPIRPNPTLAIDKETCGIVVARPRPLITHGEATHEGEFPWHAAIYHSKGVNLNYICGASLIGTRHLLTAAHCVTKPRTEIPSKVGSMVVYLGKHYLKEWSSKGIQDRKVDKVIVHPNFESDNFRNDIAIIKLQQSIDITDYVRPVCLWEGNTELYPLINREGIVTGWGFDEHGEITDGLHKAAMPIVSTESCIYSYPDFFARFTSNSTFCAGYRNGTSACNGDSGSGMVFSKIDHRTTRWQLRGIVSLSVALQNEAKCNTSHYVVFTDVAKHVDWIKEQIRL